MKILAVILLLLVLWGLVNLFMPKARFNLRIIWLYPFALHPFFNVHPRHDNNIDRVYRHEEVHCKQQASLTIYFFFILYVYYMIMGVFKYGFKKEKVFWYGWGNMPIKNKIYKFNGYNPLESEASYAVRLEQSTLLNAYRKTCSYLSEKQLL